MRPFLKSVSTARNVMQCCVLYWATGCQTDVASPSDASTPTEARPEGTLFGAKVSSYVELSKDNVTKVGVVIPLSSIENAPAEGPFQDELVLDMPVAAKQQTFLSQLRVNWLAHGHGPAPYADAHFDFHFFHGTSAEIDAIGCSGAANFPPEILTADHQYPTTCVTSMGYHAWPSADALADAAFTASLILGYVPTHMVFIEPMITRTTLLAKEDFELAITPPQKSGGDRTRYPTRLRAIYAADGLSLRMELDAFVDLE